MRGVRLTCAAVAATAILGMTTLQASAGETYYRWLDDRGNPVHSDRPPPKGVDYEVVTTGSSMVREVEGDQGAVPPELESKPGNEFDVVDSKPAVPAKNEEYCQRARENLETLNTRARIRMRDDKGEYYYLDEEQIKEQHQAALDAIESYCE